MVQLTDEEIMRLQYIIDMFYTEHPEIDEITEDLRDKVYQMIKNRWG